MKTIILSAIAGAFALVTVHAADVGTGAPLFTAKDAKGATVSLAELRGKVVVLEWVNFDCPFVKKHYGSGNMQKLQADNSPKGVVWLTISSAGEANPAYVEPSKLGELANSKGNKASHLIADGDGKIGKAYDAKTTPHMFIIDKEGKLVYNGAIDSKATTDAADVATADKLFANALDAVLAGKEVVNAKNQPYGCGVKY
ncbi:MAG: redoxin domain-containing protein [Verrucomicrobiota bacterium]